MSCQSTHQSQLKPATRKPDINIAFKTKHYRLQQWWPAIGYYKLKSASPRSEKLLHSNNADLGIEINSEWQYNDTDTNYPVTFESAVFSSARKRPAPDAVPSMEYTVEAIILRLYERNKSAEEKLRVCANCGAKTGGRGCPLDRWRQDDDKNNEANSYHADTDGQRTKVTNVT